MTQELRVLIAGESWETTSIHQKGFDIFTTTFYEEGVGPLKSALEEGGHNVTHMPSHIAATKFPTEMADLQSYDVVMLSDIGTNTLATTSRYVYEIEAHEQPSKSIAGIHGKWGRAYYGWRLYDVSRY